MRHLVEAQTSSGQYRENAPDAWAKLIFKEVCLAVDSDALFGFIQSSTGLKAGRLFWKEDISQVQFLGARLTGACPGDLYGPKTRYYGGMREQVEPE